MVSLARLYGIGASKWLACFRGKVRGRFIISA
jgi:hypothetical protein